MSRHIAREHIFQLTFEYIFSKEKNDTTLGAYLMDAGLSDEDKEYINTVYNGIIEHFDELSGLIAKYSDGFNIDRIYKPDYAAMLVGTYEMKYLPDIPSAVSINEAVDLVKRFSTEESRGFVNGVLASINKELIGEK